MNLNRWGNETGMLSYRNFGRSQPVTSCMNSLMTLVSGCLSPSICGVDTVLHQGAVVGDNWSHLGSSFHQCCEVSKQDHEMNEITTTLIELITSDGIWVPEKMLITG